MHQILIGTSFKLKEVIEKMVLMCHHSTLNAHLFVSKVVFMLNITMQLERDNIK